MTHVTCELRAAQPNMAVNMALTSLLVCSDAQAVQVLSRILQGLGISVESCGDLRMARARIEDRHFDALLVDFGPVNKAAYPANLQIVMEPGDRPQQPR